MSVSEVKFLHIYLSGDNFEAGKQHGYKLKKQIESSYDIYKRFLFFDLPGDTLADLGKRYLESFTGFSDEYVTEIEGIATGASVNVPMRSSLCDVVFKPTIGVKKEGQNSIPPQKIVACKLLNYCAYINISS